MIISLNGDQILFNGPAGINETNTMSTEQNIVTNKKSVIKHGSDWTDSSEYNNRGENRHRSSSLFGKIMSNTAGLGDTAYIKS